MQDSVNGMTKPKRQRTVAALPHCCVASCRLVTTNQKATAVGLRPNILCRRLRLDLRVFNVVCPSRRCFVGKIVCSQPPKRLKVVFAGLGDKKGRQK